jgi:hypothetical protein
MESYTGLAFELNWPNNSIFPPRRNAINGARLTARFAGRGVALVRNELVGVDEAVAANVELGTGNVALPLVRGPSLAGRRGEIAQKMPAATATAARTAARIPAISPTR